MLDNFKEKEYKKFMDEYGECITRDEDLTAGREPNLLFYLLLKKFGYLMSTDPEVAVREEDVELRRKFFPILKKLGPNFLMNKQVYENRKELLHPDTWNGEPDDEIVIPDEPIIRVSNHAFKDDTLASIVTFKRSTHILFGSLPQFYNTPDGVTGFLAGVVMMNRNNKTSKQTSLEKCIRAMELGSDLFIFPEGTWNKTPNELMIDLWPGVYKIAKETGAKIMPMAHYMRDTTAVKDKNVQIHTVLDDPFRIDDLSEKEGLIKIRDTLSSWYYLMMEKYGQSTREEELRGFDSSYDAWEDNVKRRIATADYYDVPIETSTAFRTKDKVRPQDVWEPIANIAPELDGYEGNYPKQLVKTAKKENFRENF